MHSGRERGSTASDKNSNMMLIKDGVYSNQQAQLRHNRTFHGAVTSRSNHSDERRMPEVASAYDTQGQMSVREFITASFNNNRTNKSELNYQPDTYLDKRIISWKQESQK